MRFYIFQNLRGSSMWTSPTLILWNLFGPSFKNNSPPLSWSIRRTNQQNYRSVCSDLEVKLILAWNNFWKIFFQSKTSILNTFIVEIADKYCNCDHKVQEFLIQTEDYSVDCGRWKKLLQSTELEFKNYIYL